MACERELVLLRLVSRVLRRRQLLSNCCSSYFSSVLRSYLTPVIQGRPEFFLMRFLLLVLCESKS